MRTSLTALLLAATVVGGACSQVRDTVDRAEEQVDEVVETAEYCGHAFELARAVEARDVDAAVSAGRDLVEVAPEEIADDAQRLLEAAEQAQDGDMSALQSDEVQQSAERVRTHTEDTCDPTS